MDYRETRVIGGSLERKNAFKLRKQLGMDPIRQGKRSCLKCDKVFMSQDLKTNKVCPACNKVNEGRISERDY